MKNSESIKNILNKIEFRNIRKNEVEEVAEIERICFPPEEACTLAIMKERFTVAKDCFLVAYHKEEKKLVGFINGLCSNDMNLKDEIYTNAALHDPEGVNIMICGVDVLPAYQGQGIARQMMAEFLTKQKKMKRKKAILTCVPTKVKMYEKFGYTDLGMSDSTWGGEVWHEMEYLL